MTAVLHPLIAVALSILVTRVATVALTVTDLSRESARLQARPALPVVGFTTSGCEHVVNRPVRRRSLSLLILLGNAGMVSVGARLLLGPGVLGAGGVRGGSGCCGRCPEAARSTGWCPT